MRLSYALLLLSILFECRLEMAVVSLVNFVSLVSFFHDERWIDGFWIDGFWIDRFWIDRFWIDRFWIDRFWIDRFWIDRPCFLKPLPIAKRYLHKLLLLRLNLASTACRQIRPVNQVACRYG
jgi:hypothetical protein